MLIFLCLLVLQVCRRQYFKFFSGDPKSSRVQRANRYRESVPKPLQQVWADSVDCWCGRGSRDDSIVASLPGPFPQPGSKGRPSARARFPGCVIMTMTMKPHALTHALAYHLTPPLTRAEASSRMLGQRRCHVSSSDAAATSSRR